MWHWGRSGTSVFGFRFRWHGPSRPQSAPTRPRTPPKISGNWSHFITFHSFSLIFIEFHWFSLIFIVFHWFPLVLGDIHCRVSQLRALERDASATLDTPRVMPVQLQCRLGPLDRMVSGNQQIIHKLQQFYQNVKKNVQKPMFSILQKKTRLYFNIGFSIVILQLH